LSFAKYFIIDKVFRNETLDWSHGFEFYQTEGIVIDKNVNFRNLLGYLKEFYKKMGEAEFLLSPIGDRDDCYRHYECIGLGTIPISNIGETYKPIFNENMYYCDIDKMVTILDTGVIDCSYSMPNRDLICYDYHRDMVFNRITELRNNFGPYPSGGLPSVSKVRKFKMNFM
jgi:hypothetical protein